MEEEYGVNCELRGHEGAVRCICALSSGMLVTGGMDSVARCWLRDDSSAIGAFQALESASILDHEHWVTTSVALPDGGFATGSMDKCVRLFDAQGQRLACLRGHEGGVISLVVSTCGSRLLSGSWDGTARVWDLQTQQCVQVLPGHENGVCVLGLPDGSVVTGSTGQQVGNIIADFQLRFWAKDSYELTHTLADHEGPIRQLALLPDVGFVSCSNDGSVKTRTLDGAVLSTMSHPLNAEGKPGFVLGVSVLSNGRLVSVSEDCTARVWTAQGELLQTLEHPSGLCCVTALPNGDFATGCDDKTVRVFTGDAARVDPTAVAALKSEVEEAQVARQRGPSGVEIETLPDYDARAGVQGSSDGQIQMFRRGAKAFACQWSGPSRTWIDIGEVTGTGSGGVVDGQAYDMVIPVEIELPSGLQKLQIGYNQGQNPFTVAQEFIDKHMLDKGYLREIAEYITQRAGDYQAPVLGEGTANADVSPGGEAAPSTPQYTYFPVAGYNTFETTKIAKLMTTLRQFNDKLQSYEALRDTAVLADHELLALQQVVNTVQDTAFYHSSSFAPSEMATLTRLLASWPAELVFPALDLLRLVVLHPQGPAALGDAGLDALVGQVLALGLQTNATQGDEAVPVATRMLALRVLANMFLHEVPRKALLAHKTEVLSKLSALSSTPHKLVALSLATVLLNFARVQVAVPDALSADDHVVVSSLAADLLNGSASAQQLGDDAILRALVAIGTLALVGDVKAKQAADVHVAIFVAGKASAATSPAVQACLVELQQLLSTA